MLAIVAYRVHFAGSGAPRSASVGHSGHSRILASGAVGRQGAPGGGRESGRHRIDDVVYTVEYSVHSALLAVTSLLGLETNLPPTYRGLDHPKALVGAIRAILR